VGGGGGLYTADYDEYVPCVSLLSRMWMVEEGCADRCAIGRFGALSASCSITRARSSGDGAGTALCIGCRCVPGSDTISNMNALQLDPSRRKHTRLPMLCLLSPTRLKLGERACLDADLRSRPRLATISRHQVARSASRVSGFDVVWIRFVHGDAGVEV